MASISIPAEKRELNDPAEISEFLSQYGIWYENWDVEGRIERDADPEQILAEYAPEIERLKERGNFVTADVIAVNPDTPNLDAMLAKFAKEHTHSEDEVRFTVKGSGIFHIHPENGPVFAVLVESGDLINVPAGTRHWFNLCESRTIRCIRLFEDPSGWTPHYVDAPVNEQYETVCFGPNYLPGHIHTDSVIEP